ncbi:hypothetical protein NL676_008576 [Syzygium grande]|nr:hypothetical protein NL676_008576 [Syzygium grande]
MASEAAQGGHGRGSTSPSPSRATARLIPGNGQSARPRLDSPGSVTMAWWPPGYLAGTSVDPWQRERGGVAIARGHCRRRPDQLD